MSAYRDLQLLTPPKEEEEIYPYRRVWRSLFIESGIWLGVMLVSFVLWEFLGFSTPLNWRFPSNILLAVLPALLWLLISWLPENFVLEPRPRLLTVFIVSALVANAVGLPALNTFFEPDSWLALESQLNRILGYMLTVGVIQEFLKYAVLRYIAFPRYYRVRADSVAYSVASAIGYSMVVNIVYVLSAPSATADAVAFRVFATTTVHVAASVIVAYGMSETLFSNALSYLLPLMLAIASFFVGIAIPLRASFIVAPLGLAVSEERVIFGIAVSIVLYAIPIAVMLFLFNVSDQRERDRFASEEA